MVYVLCQLTIRKLRCVYTVWVGEYVRLALGTRHWGVVYYTILRRHLNILTSCGLSGGNECQTVDSAA